MKRDKILLQIYDLNDISFYNKLGVSNLLFPLKDYSVGYKSFTFNEVKAIDSAYILMNRLLTDDDIDAFLKMDIPSNIKGFVIEDVGLYEILKNKGYEVFNFQNHLNNNYLTINYWLKYCDSLVISTDITEEEIKKILEMANKPLILNTFGYPMIMYSRRTLITNYYLHIKKEKEENIELFEKTTNSHFFVRENEYGTCIFNSVPFNCSSMINDGLNKYIKFYLINSSFCDREEIKKVIEGDSTIGTRGFLDKKTIYRVGDIK